MTIAWIDPPASWDGPDDSWRASDIAFENWLAATTVLRRAEVMAEALTDPKREPMPAPKPQPKRRPPRPVIVHTDSIPTDLDHFTNQQMALGERILGITNKEENAA